MAGWLSNGMQQIAPITVNGAVTPAGAINFNSATISEGAAPPATQVPASSLIPIDVQAGSGQQPTTVAATAFQIAAHTAGLIANAATSTAGAATLNTVSGLVTTEALTTAVGATYSFVLTNSLITLAGPAPQVQMLDKSNTAGATQVNSVTNAAGSATIVFQNTGTAAWNGTKLIAFHV